MPLATIPEAIEDFRAGKMVIIVDDEERENEGDLAVAAEKVTPEIINFMATYARGLICMPITGQRLDELGIPLMVGDPWNSSSHHTAFTVSVDAKHKTSTGISAYDRAATVHAILDPKTTLADLVMPGHIFPLRAKDGGVLVRAGHTEASVDLARLAGLYPAAVICEIMNEDGTMARLPQLEKFAERWGLKIITIRDLIAYRHQHERLVTRLAEANLPTRYGDFRIIAYRSKVDINEHVALVRGDISGDDPVLVRMHSQCLTGDVFHSLRCDCGDQIALALQAIATEGRGVLVYMRQEGRGIGLHNKILAYALQDQGMDTVEANLELGFPPDLRHYGIGAQILVDLGLKRIRLLTNNPKKVVGLEGYGLTIVEQIPIRGEVNAYNYRYLKAKQDKLGHLLDME
jgi:3,4-dihydroxy 2-butanone 4-phosphate synthase/GTP cyclohydrolase II